jgi:UDP-2-acetamido-2,6-beta-L-arabino-hexul-4-ose reductase
VKVPQHAATDLPAQGSARPRTVLVTGAGGFMGRNFLSVFGRRPDLCVVGVDVDSPQHVVDEALAACDVLVHLAGVNRPDDPSGFQIGNAELTRSICDRLSAAGNRPLVIFASSAQAELDNPYGRSKLAAEHILRAWSQQIGGAVVVFRLPNVFGKWGRPEYNSVVTTFCHHIAHDIPIRVDDPASPLELAYIDDVVAAFLDALDEAPTGYDRRQFEPVARTTVGELAELIRSFRDIDASADLPNLGDRFTRQLYATYIAYSQAESLVFDLASNDDHRGYLAELLREPHFGQVFVSRTLPGVTRGNHYHDTKIERFLVVEGSATIRLRELGGREVVEYAVSDQRLQVVVIPPGLLHSIQNTGERDMLALFWADEVFDPARPDAYYEPVLLEEELP